MNMSQRARLMMKQWVLLAFAFIIVHVLLFVSWIIIGADVRHSLTLVAFVMMMYVVLFATIVVVFCRRLNRAADPVVYREARTYGQQATAYVLKIERTRRSEEHTSELQSLMRISYAVFCLKKKKQHTTNTEIQTNIN